MSVLLVCREVESRTPDYSVVDVEESLWSLDEEDDAEGQAIKMLMITLVKPPLSEDEVKWKKGDSKTLMLTAYREICAWSRLMRHHLAETEE